MLADQPINETLATQLADDDYAAWAYELRQREQARQEADAAYALAQAAKQCRRTQRAAERLARLAGVR